MSKVFVQGRKAMKFYMDHCSEKKAIEKLIVQNGGKLVSERETDAIELVPFDVGTPFSSKSANPVYSFNFVKDSAKLFEIQDLKEYKMNKLSNAKRMTRISYKQEDDEKMQKYVDAHSGNPHVVKFWEDALAKGLDLDHTADSLRFHWKKVMPNRSNSGNKVSLPVKRVQVGSNTASPQKKIKEEKLYIPDEDELKSIKIIVKSGKRGVYDFGEINVKCEEEDIDDKFERLVNVCSTLSGRRVSIQEVLRALIARNGVVAKTLDHFRTSNQ